MLQYTGVFIEWSIPSLVMLSNIQSFCPYIAKIALILREYFLKFLIFFKINPQLQVFFSKNIDICQMIF
jgi:hypothetical protein